MKVRLTECAYRNCRKQFPEKPGKRFCCARHRYWEYDQANPRKRRATAVRKPRRASRNGHGIKLYLTPSNLADLEAHLSHLSLPVANKVRAARDRLDRA